MNKNYEKLENEFFQTKNELKRQKNYEKENSKLKVKKIEYFFSK